MRDVQVSLRNQLTEEKTDLAMREACQTFQCGERGIGPGAIVIGMAGDGDLEPGALLAILMSIGFPSGGWAATDWNAVAKALGKTGTEMPGGIYRVGLPRSDLHVQLGDIELKPTFALGSWVAFAPMGEQAMVMGDLVLTEDEIEPVMKSLLENGLQITALHNHLFNARPATFYMHIGGMGNAVNMANAIHGALVLSKTPFTSPPPPARAS